MEPKAIPTWYNGQSYRSRLEADFARMLDALKIRFEYEPQSFLLDNGTHYLPDFWCQDLRLWVECRGYRSAKGKKQIGGFIRLLRSLEGKWRPTGKERQRMSYMALSCDWGDTMIVTDDEPGCCPLIAWPGVLPICDRCGRGSFVPRIWQGQTVTCRRCLRGSEDGYAQSLFVSERSVLMVGDSTCRDVFTNDERLLVSEPSPGRSWPVAEWLDRHEAGWAELREWQQGPSLSGLDDA